MPSEVQKSLLHQNTPTTWCCHSHTSQLRWCSETCKHPSFSPKCNYGHYSKTAQLQFHQTTGHVSKNFKKGHCFWCCFWSNGFFLVKLSFSPCRSPTHFSVDNDTLSPASVASSQGVLLLFWGWYAHFTPKHIHLWDTEPVSFLSGMLTGHLRCLYMGIIVRTDECCTFRHLEIVPKDEPNIRRSTI